MIVDVCTYNGEKELWDIHYSVLKDSVDKFIVVEFDETFSGKPKESKFPVQHYPGVEHHFFSADTWGKYRELAESSPNTQGAAHWKQEFMQKESIKDALVGLADEDIVFVGDVDEVWDPQLPWKDMVGRKIGLKVYTYYLNNRSSEIFNGPICVYYKEIQSNCLNHLRTRGLPVTHDAGWHFTSMGGEQALREKLTDSYTQESYATPSVLENIAYNISNRKDFLGRDFTYSLDESQWPQFLKDNREKYAHLLATP